MYIYTHTYIFLECYQPNITNHSNVRSLKLGSILCKTQIIIFIDISHLGFSALHWSLCTENKLGN